MYKCYAHCIRNNGIAQHDMPEAFVRFTCQRHPLRLGSCIPVVRGVGITRQTHVQWRRVGLDRSAKPSFSHVRSSDCSSRVYTPSQRVPHACERFVYAIYTHVQDHWRVLHEHDRRLHEPTHAQELKEEGTSFVGKALLLANFGEAGARKSGSDDVYFFDAVLCQDLVGYGANVRVDRGARQATLPHILFQHLPCSWRDIAIHARSGDPAQGQRHAPDPAEQIQ